MYLDKLKEMLHEMVFKKDAAVIPQYFHPDFQFFINSKTKDYDLFLKSHQELFATPIQFEIEYDEETFLEKDDKVAGRLWLTTSQPDEPATRTEFMLIAQYRAGKIFRLWELMF